MGERRIRSEADFRALVVERYESLPPQQQSVADFLLGRAREAALLSVPEIARATGASEATIVRFAQRLGYAGFTPLKAELVEALRARVSGKAARLPAEDLLAGEDRDTLAAVARLESANVGQSIDELDREEFRRAAASLVEAELIYVFGLGISAHLAEMLVYLLVQVGARASVVSTSFSSPLEQLVTMRRGDALVAFSFPPYSRDTIELVRRASDEGLRCVAICDRPTAPVAKIARHALPMHSENMMFTNAFAAVSVLLNALTIEFALRNRDEAAEAVGRISEILARDEGVIDEN